ncbi:hypothetical protein OTSSIDO_0717 [Orientia tsutsugamushi str. Sido]|nr:hypothetical protein OTSSIDO_0717 [Orientia tsutsugamushi str. Sido]
MVIIASIALKFTKLLLSKIEILKEKTTIVYRDSDESKLIIRVSYSGRKIFYFEKSAKTKNRAISRFIS